MSSTVQMGHFELSSNSESAEDMVKALTPPEPKGKEPKALVDRGKPVGKDAEEQQKVVEAARELGKRGAEAAAKAREEKAKEAKEAPEVKEKPAEAQAKEKPAPEELKAHGAAAEARHEPEARMRQALAQRAEAERRLEDERRERQALAERLERLEQAVRPAQAQQQPQRPAGKPQAADYNTHEEWVEALADWKLEQRLTERDRQQQEEAQLSQQDEQIGRFNSSFVERVQKAKEADPEVLNRIDPRLLQLQTPEQAVESGRGIGPGEVMTDLIRRSEYPVEMYLYLTEHEDAVVRLLKTNNPVELAIEFGRMEARVAGEQEKRPATRPQTVSNAPPPLTPLKTSSAEGEADPYASGREVSFDEHMRAKGRRR